MMSVMTLPETPVLDEKRRFLAGGALAVLLIAVAKLILHVAVNGRYGYFRDEPEARQ
jgi:hypothetical protein